MATAVQVQYRRGSATQVASFTGAQGEMVIDTTNNRVVVQDGATAGGFPAAKLSDLAGGSLNKFRNGTIDVWQRGTSLTATTAGAYTADGWIVLPTGASVTAAQAGGRLLTKNSLQVTGASSVTDVIIKQRIESLIAATLCSQTVTVQAQVYNNTGTAITPKLTVNHPGTQDPSTALSSSYANTDVSAVSLQSCANGAWTQVAYSFQANANSYNGLEVIFDFGNNFGANSKSVQITELDIRVTNGIPAGQPTPSSLIPPPELRPINTELAFCQRYYEVVSWAAGTAYSTTGISMAKSFEGQKRAAPTIALLTTAPTITQFAVGFFTGSGCALVGGGTSAMLDGVSVAISGFSGLTANALNPVFSTTSGLLSASAEL